MSDFTSRATRFITETVSSRPWSRAGSNHEVKESSTDNQKSQSQSPRCPSPVLSVLASDRSPKSRSSDNNRGRMHSVNDSVASVMTRFNISHSDNLSVNSCDQQENEDKKSVATSKSSRKTRRRPNTENYMTLRRSVHLTNEEALELRSRFKKIKKGSSGSSDSIAYKSEESDTFEYYDNDVSTAAEQAAAGLSRFHKCCCFYSACLPLKKRVKTQNQTIPMVTATTSDHAIQAALCGGFVVEQNHGMGFSVVFSDTGTTSVKDSGHNPVRFLDTDSCDAVNPSRFRAKLTRYYY